jgi:hypothetical protein
MTSQVPGKRRFSFSDFCKSLIPWGRNSAQDSGKIAQDSFLSLPGGKVPTPAQRQNLEMLCSQLFKKKELITSGKLQLIGLAQVKKKIGKAWEEKRSGIYAIIEDVLKQHMVRGDFFVRYKDDTYVIIFGVANFDEGNVRTARIAEEIRKRLFDSADQSIAEIGVAHSTGQSKSADLRGKSMDQALDIMTLDSASAKTPDSLSQSAAAQRPTGIKPTQVQAWPGGGGVREQAEDVAPRGDCSYFPLWDVSNSALSFNLCSQDDASLDGAARDFRTLQIMAEDIMASRQKGVVPMILCPVRYGTLCHHEYGPRYLDLCRALLSSHRQCVVFVISDFIDGALRREDIVFLSALRELSVFICAEIPIGQKISFGALRESGIDALKFSLPDIVRDETRIITQLGNAAKQAENARFSHIFITNIVTRSLATSLTCAGFRYLGGPAIHRALPLPETRAHFDHQQLFDEVMNR